MLFAYTYINHSIERLHAYVEHLVLEVWCKASGSFNTSKLKIGFRPIVEKNKKFLHDPIVLIYDLFVALKAADKKIIADGFKRNNNIEGICKGTVEPFRFSDLDAIDQKLSAAL